MSVPDPDMGMQPFSEVDSTISDKVRARGSENTQNSTIVDNTGDY